MEMAKDLLNADVCEKLFTDLMVAKGFKAPDVVTTRIEAFDISNVGVEGVAHWFKWGSRKWSWSELWGWQLPDDAPKVDPKDIPTPNALPSQEVATSTPPKPPTRRRAARTTRQARPARPDFQQHRRGIK